MHLLYTQYNLEILGNSGQILKPAAACLAYALKACRTRRAVTLLMHSATHYDYGAKQQRKPPHKHSLALSLQSTR
jgi:hypothetical protein